jgi:GNAT superfamily N-acetyltransferase
MNVYTQPAYRRQGLARRIMLEILAWARGAGLGRAALHASGDGRSLYTGLGFQPTNEMRVSFDSAL